MNYVLLVSEFCVSCNCQIDFGRYKIQEFLFYIGNTIINISYKSYFLTNRCIKNNNCGTSCKINHNITSRIEKLGGGIYMLIHHFILYSHSI